ncbi:MAG: hypothetical protein Tsb0013_11000 [Phycisphaerales bacterium]
MDSYSFTLVLLGIGAVVIIVGIVMGVVASCEVKKRRLREETKREIAAYVAEGTIDPADGAKMIAAAERGEVPTKHAA